MSDQVEHPLSRRFECCPAWPCTPIQEPVSVQLLLDAERQLIRPFRLKWRGKVYVVKEVGKYHSGRQGTVKLHYFTVNVGTGSIAGIDEYIWDRIPFGSVTDLEELYSEQEAWPIPVEGVGAAVDSSLGLQGEVAPDLVAPGAPAGDLLPGKQFCARHVPADVNDLVAHFIWLAGVFAPGRDNQAG